MSQAASVIPVLLVFLYGRATTVEGACTGIKGCATHDINDEVSLMQIHQSAKRRGSKTNATIGLEGASCESLINQGAYFTIPVHVGTPEQHFNLVADTGSDALIIPDCRCKNAGYCDNLESCFEAEKSSSFGLDIKRKTKNSVAVMGAKMNYGSGQIQVLVASEHVRVGQTHASMDKGVFLMEDRRSLNVHGDFEGILGLGLPHKKKLSKEGINIPSFLESSTASRYTICFNEYPNAGSLRIGMDSLPNPMTNIGTVHWGLDLHGFTAGDADGGRLFCDPKLKKKGQVTACGAIPDSGTTLMMGPKKHIRLLYKSLCEKWPRCMQSAQTKKQSHDQAFHDLLADCETWMTDEQGVNEVPSVFLHLAGEEGQSQAVELSAWAYVVETNQEIYKVVTTKIFGALPIAAAVDTGKKKKICTASFGPQEYNTVQNGPVWIMGAPIFYAATLGYDIGDSAAGRKGAMSFIDGACKSCSDSSGTSMLSADVRQAAHGHHPAAHGARRLRHVHTIREPGIDMSDSESI
jgi:hypothetical protein